MNVNTQIFWKKQINKYSKYNFSDLFFDEYDYDDWFMKPNKKNLIDLLPTLPIECNKEEGKEGARIKFLTSNKLLARLRYY